MRLLLLRHGQTVANVNGALDTAVPGLELTELGRRQAGAAAWALADEGIEAIAVSTATRTGQTAAPLAEALGSTPAAYDGLREIAAGDFEMRHDQEALEGYLGTIGGWLEGDLGRPMPGGETGTEFLRRYDAAMARICSTASQTVLVVTHGAAIRAWVTHRATGDHAPAHEPLHNTGCIRLEGSLEEGWSITAWEREPVGGAWLEDETAPDPTGGELDADEAPAQSSGS